MLAREIDDDLGISSLTLTEVLVAPARDDRIDEVTGTRDELKVRQVPFPAGAGAKLARLRAETMVKMPDCCVLQAAEQVEALLASFDDRLRRAAQARTIIALDG